MENYDDIDGDEDEENEDKDRDDDYEESAALPLSRISAVRSDTEDITSKDVTGALVSSSLNSSATPGIEDTNQTTVKSSKKRSKSKTKRGQSQLGYVEIK